MTIVVTTETGRSIAHATFEDWPTAQAFARQRRAERPDATVTVRAQD